MTCLPLLLAVWSPEAERIAYEALGPFSKAEVIIILLLCAVTLTYFFRKRR